MEELLERRTVTAVWEICQKQTSGSLKGRERGVKRGLEWKARNKVTARWKPAYLARCCGMSVLGQWRSSLHVVYFSEWLTTGHGKAYGEKVRLFCFFSCQAASSAAGTFSRTDNLHSCRPQHNSEHKFAGFLFISFLVHYYDSLLLAISLLSVCLAYLDHPFFSYHFSW